MSHPLQRVSLCALVALAAAATAAAAQDLNFGSAMAVSGRQAFIGASPGSG